MEGFETAQEQKRLREILWRLGLCSCGSNATYGVLHELLLRAAENCDGGERTGFYQPMSDASKRWSEFGAHVLDSWDLVEHGTGIGWPWLTADGLIVLAFLERFGSEDDSWPEWAQSEIVE